MKTNKLKTFLKTSIISTAIGIIPISFLTSCSNSNQDSTDIKITFDAGEGKIISGSNIVKLPKESKVSFGSINKPVVNAANKIFAGWSIVESSGKQQQVTDSTIIDKSYTIKANYVDNTSGLYWTITFNSITGSYITGNNIVAVKNNIPFFTVNKPVATKENAVFRHWSATQGGPAFSETTIIGQNYVLYPVFANQVTITYGIPTVPATGFSYLGPTSVVALDTDTFATIGRPNPIADGYHFDGWYFDAGCTAGQEVAENHTFSANTTIYPKMTPNT